MLVAMIFEVIDIYVRVAGILQSVRSFARSSEGNDLAAFLGGKKADPLAASNTKT